MVSLRGLLGFQEVCHVGFLKMVASELLGTSILVLIGCGSVCTLSPGLSPPTMAVALSFGLALALSIWVFGQTSGSHVNPAVSIGFLVTGQMSIMKCLLFIASQTTGAIIGAGVLCLTVPEPWREGLGSTTLAENVQAWQGLLIEIISTFLLVLTVMASVDRLRTDHSGSTALSIGLCVSANIAWSGNVTGGSMNPARSFGPAVWSGRWDNHWIYWVAPCGGAILAALAYHHIFSAKRQDSGTNLRLRDAMNHKNFAHCSMEIDSPTTATPTVMGFDSPPPPPRHPRLLSLFDRVRHHGGVSRLNSVQSTKTILSSGSGVYDSDGSDAGSIRGLTVVNTGNCWDGGQKVSITRM